MGSFGAFRSMAAGRQASSSQPQWSLRKRVTVVVISFILLTIFISAYEDRKRLSKYVCDATGTCETIIDEGKHAAFPYRRERRVSSLSDAERANVNSTLGFEKIYVLNQAQRRDRLSVIQLLMAQYNLTYTRVEGIDGGAERPTQKPALQFRYGKSQGHAKIWQLMLQDRVQSALILEDHFDMDVRIHQQIQQLQQPFAIFQHILSGGNTTRLAPHDSWNTAFWDLLWLGQCKEAAWTSQDLPPSYKGLPYLTYADPSSPEAITDTTMFDTYQINFDTRTSGIPSRQRIIQPARDARCTTAYAITLSGAARSLYHITHKLKLDDIDEDLMALTRQGRLRSFTVSPALFQARKALSGSTLKDGTPMFDEEKTTVPIPGQQGVTPGIEKSAREQLPFDILGGNDVQVIWKQDEEEQEQENSE